ncbi:MAG TPA: biosynthetic arginine decarboxylase, partial [Pseudomonadales bacterium]
MSSVTSGSRPAPAAAGIPDAPDWSVDDAAELYRVAGWSDGFFVVNEAGHMAVRPFEDQQLSIDIMDVIDELRRRGVRFPALLRFQDVLRARVQRLSRAFGEAIRESGYESPYRAIYPIKVNQLHEVVEEVLDAGKPFGLGLECGSRAELVATVAHLDSDETPLICNGVKDRRMLSLVLSMQELGKNVIPVMEKYAEFEELLDVAAERNVSTQFGVRVRLRTAGAGKWAESGGYQSKFGISLPELLKVIERLEESGAGHRLVLMHFHLGSQIVQITQLKQAAKELAQTYAELITAGLPVRYIDVGGGLGVNYTGGFEEGQINYSLQEYANSVVTAIKEVCDDRGVPHPVLMSESGRAMTAHHSVLVVEALGAFQKDRAGDFALPDDAPRTLERMYELLEWLRKDNVAISARELIEAYHDVIEFHEEAHTLFNMGYLSLAQNAMIERMYWSSCSAILRRLRLLEPDPLPPEFDQLQELLV